MGRETRHEYEAVRWEFGPGKMYLSKLINGMQSADQLKDRIVKPRALPKSSKQNRDAISVS